MDSEVVYASIAIACMPITGANSPSTLCSVLFPTNFSTSNEKVKSVAGMSLGAVKVIL